MKFIHQNKKALLVVLAFIFLYWWTYPALQANGTIKVYDRNGTLLYEAAGTIGRKIPVRYSDIPQSLINATVAAEDKTFWSNAGVDIWAIVRSALANMSNGKIVSGGSTITQQLARTSVIGGNPTMKRSWLRKIQEMLIAVRLTFSFEKKQILTNYFNEVYYGNHSVGAQAAAHYYFGKDISQLSIAESAMLAGLVASPTAYDPYLHPKAAQLRQRYVLEQMEKNKSITQEQLQMALTQPMVLNLEAWEIRAPYFVDYVLQQIQEKKLSGRYGLKVYTTLDYSAYTLSQDIARRWVQQLQGEHNLSNAALVMIDNHTGEILNMLGGIDYFDASHSGQVNVTVSLRQPGSALKPVTYASAFIRGYTPATLIYDVPTVYKTKKGQGYAPNNYDGKFHGMVLAREALASSLNLPAVEMIQRVGIDNFIDVAHKMGITTLNNSDRYDLSVTLGGGEVKLLDLTNIYATLARGGGYLPTYAISRITDDRGHELYHYKQMNQVNALGKKSAQVAYLVTDILSDAQARAPGFGEKNPLVLSRQAAVKTGTTTDWHDNWTVGYTPSYTVGVWVGNNDNTPMKKISGVVGAAPIWNQFLEEYLKGKPVEHFKRPEGIVEVEVCKLDGLLPGQECVDHLREKFITGTEPKTVSKSYKKIPIDTRNSLLAGKDCTDNFVSEKVFIDYPPQVFSWAESTGQTVIPRQYSLLCTGNVSGSNYLAITHPKSGAVFTYAPDYIANQGITLSVSASSTITNVDWFLDNKILKTVSQPPFSTIVLPPVGVHTIKAIGVTRSGEKVSTDSVVFKFEGDTTVK